MTLRAFEALEVKLRWEEAQNECNFAELNPLNRVSDLAAKKS